MFQSIDAPVPGSPLTWRKASYSTGNGSNCVELASVAHIVAIRDSKNPNGPVLAFHRREIAALAARIRRSTL